MTSVSIPQKIDSLKLLIADDDAVILEYLERALRAQGHQVTTASNGQQALALALRDSPQVVITDWLMPEMDGVSLCRALRETVIGRGIYVVVMTDSESLSRVVDAFDAGADDYVRKPVSMKVLAAHLAAARRVLNSPADLERGREEMRRAVGNVSVEPRV